MAGNSIHDNAGHGVSVDGLAGDVATIGVPGGVNQIEDNGADGVTVTGTATARIRDDLISGNTGLGIDLGNDGVTANDALERTPSRRPAEPARPRERTAPRPAA